MAVSGTEAYLFAFRPGRGIIYRIPAWIKILLMLLSGSIVFFIPPEGCAVLSLLLAGYSMHTGMTFKDVLSVVKPAGYYAVILYCASAFSGIFIPQKSDLLLCLQLTTALLCANLLFSTTTPLSMRRGIETIEKAVRKVLPVQKKASFAETYAFFILFIPAATGIWHRIDCAWKARGGKNGLRKIIVLFPVLISLCMHRAWITERAVRNRKFQQI